MTRLEPWFLLLLAVNLIITLIYLIWGIVFRSKQEGKTHYILKSCVMLLCPLIGPLYILIGYLDYRLFMHRKVDLSDVMFSKQRTRSLVRADEEREKNMVPLEEAIAITDKENLRAYMLNVLRGNVQDSLMAISLALNSEDSETSHYAASVLRDELNDFRVTVQKIYEEIKREDETSPDGEEADGKARDGEPASDTKERDYDEEQLKYCTLFLEYVNPVLQQHVFTDMEQRSFTAMMDEVAEILYRHGKERMKAAYYEWVCLRLIDSKELERAEIWGKRSKEEFGGELSSYTCLLKLYFTMEKKESFFAVLEELKQSHIVVDNETLELIRVFS